MAEAPVPLNEDFDLSETILKAEGGDLAAKWALVLYLATSGHANANEELAVQKMYYTNLCDLIATEYPPAYINIMLGDALLEGIGCNQDADEAIRWYEKAVRSGVTLGNERIGEIYYAGKNVSTDYGKAFQYFTKDDAQKSFSTRYHLAEMYRQGLFVSRNPAKACEYYYGIVDEKHEGRENDDYYWRACYRLADALLHGEGVERDLTKALKLWGQARKSTTGHSLNHYESDITEDDMNSVLGEINKGLYYEQHYTYRELKECPSILSEQRLRNYKAISQETDDTCAKWQSNYFEIIAQLTHNKMSDEEMLAVHDLLSDVLVGGVPKIIWRRVEKRDAGRLLMGLMSDIESTARLTQDEKRWFAFCICLYVYIIAYDDKTDDTQPGVVCFTSLEHIKDFYVHLRDKSTAPFFFETADKYPTYDTQQPFGYSVENPIVTVSINDSYRYLRRLKSRQGSLSMNRECSISGSFDEILDKWSITINMPDNQFEKHTLYINPYGLQNPSRAPDGFILEEEKESS